MSDEPRTVTGDEYVAKHVGVMIGLHGLSAMPADALRVAQFGRPGEDTAGLVAVTSWFGRHGLYSLLTPEGARWIANKLLAAADGADKANTEAAAKLMNRAKDAGE